MQVRTKKVQIHSLLTKKNPKPTNQTNPKTPQTPLLQKKEIQWEGL